MQLAKAIILLLLTIQHSCLALYIKNVEKNPAKNGLKDDWGVFKNTLGLSQEKVELLKSQKDQQGTKELLNRFILENPKALPKAKKQPDQFLALYRSILKKLTASRRMLKTSLNFELADKPRKELKRPRRKIAVKMVSDMPSWKIESLLNSFYLKHGIPRNAEEHDYPDLDMARDIDYDSDNFYDDEGDVELTAKTRQNTEYGSFQDLIMQAKMNEWERESEETKLHSPDSDDYI
ncbi:uncharacterized protein LOC119563505 [Drosophila subpulchrella]|uniref:uncharacterized protein LOC119563505 n=1 Tax=Drosophila subpulchrella TaxID=1486046 RepID=UPI0018A179F0|nr:uncharacterized protein LOC119563505 [Drosophila subpulchrella]